MQKPPYWLVGVQYIDCTRDETAAISQLQDALVQPDTSRYQSAPDYINRLQNPKTQIAYQPLVDEKKADNRARMLENVYQSWIVGALKPNLQAGTIELGLGLKADAVLRHADYGEYQLPESSRAIAQVFNDMNGELLILGEAGSGKTILMLQLAEQLLALAQADEKQAIPVVLNLSSWAQKKEPLEKWLTAELKRSYTVPEKQAQEWLSQQKLSLLLDGLDEIAPSQSFGDEQSQTELDGQAIQLRSEAVEAINEFRIANPSVDMVICSRIRDYEALSQKFNLNGAILLQALSDKQIDAYLAGEACIGIRELLATEKSARELANVPFILSTMKSSYREMPYHGNPHHRLKLENEQQSERLDHLFRVYLEKQLDAVPQTNYPRKQSLYYLQWLAYQMFRRKTSLFHIEDLQPSWTSNEKNYRLVSLLIIVLFVGLLSACVGGLIFTPIIGLGLTVLEVTSIGLIIGLIFGLLFGLVGGLGNIKFAEKIGFYLSNKMLSIGLLFGLIFVLIFGLRAGVAFGLVVGLLVGAMVGLIFGLEPETSIQFRVKPNSGLAQSIKNGLILGLSVGLAFGLILGLSIGLILGLNVGLVFGLIFGLGANLILSLIGGLQAVIQHSILRLILAREGYVPRWRYDTFLDYAAEAGFLRKVGGGYIFRHRMLLEYFAEQYQEQQVARNKPPVQPTKS